jgi:hypothetical protein
MESISKNDLKLLHDMCKDMFEKINQTMSEMKQTMSEMKADRQNFLKKISEENHNLQETNQELKNCVSEIREEIKAENVRMDSELKVKIEVSSKDINEKDDKVNRMIQEVQVEDNNCTEENLKRQGEKTAPLNRKSKDLQNELNEGLNKSQVREVALVQNESSGFRISPTQADQKATNGITRERTRAYKSICLFMKYAYNFITVIIDITVYEKDRAINNDKVKRNKKCKKLEWCINVKEKDVSTNSLKEIRLS